MPASVEEAIVSRLKAVATAAGTRVYATAATEDAPLPLVVVTKQGAEGGSRMDGARKLKRYAVGIDCYATTEAAAEALGRAVRDALTPDGGTPWQDAALGAQGCFFSDSAAGLTDEGWRVQTESFGVWFEPTN